jgi:creatinine amidohydrolase
MKDRLGSHNIPTRVLSDFVFEVINGFRTWKIKYVVLLTGHGGNIEPLHDAAERASDLGIKTVVLGWWVRGFREAYKGIVEDLDGHAGEAETSLLMHMGERYVDTKLIPKEKLTYPPAPIAGAGTDMFDPGVNPIAGPKDYAGRPIDASADKGKLLKEKAAKVVVEVIDALKSGSIAK